MEEGSICENVTIQRNAESLKYHLPFHSRDVIISTNTNTFMVR